MILAFSPMDIIKVPFGYIMEWLYQLTSNYGVSLILLSSRKPCISSSLNSINMVGCRK